MRGRVVGRVDLELDDRAADAVDQQLGADQLPGHLVDGEQRGGLDQASGLVGS